MYSPSPALNDPRTVLHVLSFKAALPLLLALLMPDCPHPTSIKWLMRRTGVKTRETVYDSLEFLAELGVAVKTPGLNGSSWWQLSESAFQLPLPVSRSPLPKPQSTQFEETSAQSFLDESAQSHHAESTQSQRVVANLAHRVESAQSQRVEANPDYYAESAQSQPIVADLSIKSTPPLNVDVDVHFKDHFGSNYHHQSDVSGVSAKSTPLSPSTETATPTAVFLHEIGLDDPVPQEYANYPLDAAVGYWWSALVRKMQSPHGWLRRRLEQDHSRPTEGFLELAVAWLKLSGDQRRFLWEEAVYSCRVSRTGSAYLSLPDDFPYIPYKPLLRLAYAFQKSDGDLQFIPDSIAWEDDESEESTDRCASSFIEY